MRAMALLLLIARAALGSQCPTKFVDGIPITTCKKADARFDAIRNGLIEAIRRGEIPSASVAAIEHGTTIWEESIGWSDREKKIPATPDHAYLLASMGKSVTATAVMQLVQRGKIDLDAPISRYLGNVRLIIHDGNEDAVTVARVLDMTAEIPHGGLAFSSLEARKEYSTATLIRNRGFIVFPAGTFPMYSNMNYAVIEQMLEATSGKSYRALMHDALFVPLEMHHSWVGPIHSDAAKLYTGDGKALPPTFSMPESSLSMYASLADLLRYTRLHLGLQKQPYLQPETLSLMQMHRSGIEHALMAFGIGRIDLDSKRVFLLTNGRASGGQSSLGMLPGEQTAAICLINKTGNRADNVIFRITDLLSPGSLDAIQKRIADYEAWSNRPFHLTPEMIGEWKGSIVTSRAKIPIMLTFKSDGDVHVKVGDQLETLVNEVGYDDGLLSGSFLAEVPAEEAAGHAHTVRIALRQEGDRLSGYVTSEFTNSRGSFSLPSYVFLDKAKSTAK